MKIIHLVSYFQPQLGYQEYFLAREHRKMGHDVTVITSDRYFPYPDYDKTNRPILGDRIVGAGVSEYENIKVIRLPIRMELNCRPWLVGIEEQVKKIQPDIIISHSIGTFSSLRVARLKPSLNFKFVVDDHMLWSEENNSFLARLYYAFFDFKKILKQADRVVGVADECVEYIVKKYKFPRNRVEMIPLGANTDLFQRNTEGGISFRKKQGIDLQKVLITYTGKLTYLKGSHNIIAAIARIKEQVKGKVALLFVGNAETEYVDFFENELKKISDYVDIHRMPAVKNPELVEIYSATDIAVWPRQASMSMIEAMSCEVPIICCDFLTERYKNNNGIPIKEDDIEDLANALLKLIENPSLRHEMGKNGQDLVQKEFNWRVIAEKFIV
jgi:glycosyltransferase involved in cell wall biosynthesis